MILENRASGSLTLRTAAPSPFGHKILSCASIAGLSLVSVPASTLDVSDTLRSQNPLGKIPVLIFPDGSSLFDSTVIVEYLHELAPEAALIPKDRMERLDAYQLQALADGVCDAAILIFAEFQWQDSYPVRARWLAHQAGKIRASLTHLSKDSDALSGRRHVGSISLACTLLYLKLRFGDSIQDLWPVLFARLEEFLDAHPEIKSSRPEPTNIAKHLPHVPSDLLRAVLLQNP